MEAARDAGDYDVIVNNFRQAKSTLDDDAFNRYVEIVGNHDVDALRKSFKKSTIVLKDGAEQTVLNEVDKLLYRWQSVISQICIWAGQLLVSQPTS